LTLSRADCSSSSYSSSSSSSCHVCAYDDKFMVSDIRMLTVQGVSQIPGGTGYCDHDLSQTL
jgi:hypothetical protein